MKLEFSRNFSNNNQISNFTLIRPGRAELSREDGRPDRHDEANSRFSQFCESSQKHRCFKSYIKTEHSVPSSQAGRYPPVKMEQTE